MEIIRDTHHLEQSFSRLASISFFCTFFIESCEYIYTKDRELIVVTIILKD